MSNIENILKNFDQNQLRQINSFLSTAQGQRLKKKINSSDKQKLLREFSKLDEREVSSRLRGLSKDELMRIIKNL
ncbi:MAG: hypothetical protein PUF72_09645 [Clostridiales bacterium]|nr:hypothetical protein [Clostridiales bacterium]